MIGRQLWLALVGISLPIAAASAATRIDPTDPAVVYSPYNWIKQDGAATTINAGAYFRTLFSGDYCALEFDTSHNRAPISQIWYRIDASGPWIEAPVASEIKVVITRDQVPLHLIEVVVKSTSQKLHRWATPSETALVFKGLEIANHAKVVRPPVRPANILVLGDSTVEGVRTVNYTAHDDTDQNDAMSGWAFQIGGLLDAEVGVVGFGSTGVTKGGSGGVPSIGQFYHYVMDGHARNFKPLPNLTVVEIGANDAKASSGEMQDKTSAFLMNLLKSLPGEAKVAVLEPFNRAQNKTLASAVSALSSNRMTYISTSEIFDAQNGADNYKIHPNGVNDTAIIAPLLAAKLQPLMGR